MKDILIWGAGGFGREVVWLIEGINKINPTWHIVGFIDDDISKIGQIINGYEVIGNSEILETYNKETWIAASIGDPQNKTKAISKLRNPNLKYPVLIHPSVIMSRSIEIGEGTIICAGSILTVNIKIGKHTIINLDCTIGHDAIIGNYCTISPSVNISGNVSIGEKTFIGTGAHIINDIKIGENVVIGAGAVVVNNIPSNCTAVGIPARPIKYNE